MTSASATSVDVDVAVVGAGFAGLQAARDLEKQGFRVQVLEARDRVGGRSMAGTLNGRTIDVGGQWVGTGHEHLTALVAEAGTTLVPQYATGRKVMQIAGRTRTYAGLIPPVSPRALVEMQCALWRLRSLQKQVDPAAPWTAEHAAALDAETVASWQKRWLRSRGAQAIFDIGVRAVFCARPGQLSMLAFLNYLASNGSFDQLISAEGGAQAAVVQGGMHQLSVYLSTQLATPVMTACPVHAIDQDGDGVRVTHAHGQLRARRVIVAMAPSMARKIRMQPEPTARQRLGDRMPMGSVIKCLVAYERPFWRDKGLCGEFVSDTAPFSPVFDTSPADASCGMLVGFFDGPEALRWSGNPEGRRQAVIKALVDAFGPEATHPVDYVDHDWIADPWSEGCYVGLPVPGALSELGPMLTAPQGFVHWAGTESAPQWTGYIEGALLSGERAASDVAKALRGPSS
jgi:monoamine oxidase